MASYEEPGMGGDPGAAQQSVTGPAIALLVTAILGTLLQVYSLIQSLIGGEAAQKAQIEQIRQQNPQLADQLETFVGTAGPMGLALGVLSIIIGIVIILGALKMKNLQSYGLAKTSSILALIPCISPCCCITLPFGIWALVVLNRPEVRAAFRP
jgi:hypothetical protein